MIIGGPTAHRSNEILDLEQQELPSEDVSDPEVIEIGEPSAGGSNTNTPPRTPGPSLKKPVSDDPAIVLLPAAKTPLSTTHRASASSSKDLVSQAMRVGVPHPHHTPKSQGSKTANVALLSAATDLMTKSSAWMESLGKMAERKLELFERREARADDQLLLANAREVLADPHVSEEVKALARESMKAYFQSATKKMAWCVLFFV